MDLILYMQQVHTHHLGEFKSKLNQGSSLIKSHGSPRPRWADQTLLFAGGSGEIRYLWSWTVSEQLFSSPTYSLTFPTPTCRRHITGRQLLGGAAGQITALSDNKRRCRMALFERVFCQSRLTGA